MLDCLINLIGLKDCGTEAPSSGLYLNTLAGISLKQLQRIANAEQQNYLGVWNDVQENAAAEFFADFQTYLNMYYKIDCCTEGCSVEDIFCNYVSQLAIPYRFLLGVHVMNERLYSERVNYFTTIGKEEAEELQAFYRLEYEKFLKAAMQRIPNEILAGCFKCLGGAISYQSNMP